MKNKKRICLFAAYDKNNYIHDYVVYYLQELSKFADIYYLAECPMTDSELEKIKPYTIERYAYSHGKYDFGSWQELIYKIGWDKLSEYDELILANDSCFAPIFPLNDLFEKGEKSNCDFYGNTDFSLPYQDNHIQSYFIVLKRKIVASKLFQDFINSIERKNTQFDFVVSYEINLSKILFENNFIGKRFLNRDVEIYNQHKDLIIYGSPFLKTKSFTEVKKYHNRQSFFKYDEFLKKYSDYDINLIKKYLNANGINYSYFNSLKYKWTILKYYRKLIKHKFTSIFKKKKLRKVIENL